MHASLIRGWSWLALTVVLEVVGTLCLRASDGFTVLVPSLVSITAYAATVVALSLALKVLPMGMAYVVWTGAGTTGVVVFSRWLFDESMTLLSYAGIALVVAGVMMINARRGGQEGHGQIREHAE